MLTTDRYGTPLEDPKPTAQYQSDGTLAIQFPYQLVEQPTFHLTRYLLVGDLDPLAAEWEPCFGDALSVRWDTARVVERRLQCMWPGFAASAANNPRYSFGQRAAEIAGRR